MKRDISYTILQRLISMVLCLGIILSSSSETDLFDIFSGLNIYAEAADEMPKDNEYDNETLEAMFADTTYPNAARSCYTCAADTTANASVANSFASFGGVKKRTIFHVFAFEGDTICIGSSVCNSALDLETHARRTTYPDGGSVDSKCYGNDATTHYPDEGSVDVVMTDLHGKNIPIDIRENDDNKTGYIGSPDVEHAAVLMEKQSDGTYKGILTDNTGTVKATYTPYTYKVTETGVYTFEFHSYDKTGTPQVGKRSEQWATYETNYYDATYGDCGGMIAALNLTVFDENGFKQTGRTYADFLSLQMGDKNKNTGVHEAYYILTTDSYIYKMQFNGAAPYTYNFFANNRGIYDDNGKIIYKSVKDIKNDNSFTRMGSLFRYPGTGDTDYFKSFYIFLEYPDPKLEGYLFEKAVPPDPAKNVKFVSTVEVENKEVPGAYEGMGGYFEFDVDEATTATLRLEFKKSGEGGSGAITEDYAPVEISTTVTPHTTNRVYWDGRDGNGKVIPAGKYSMQDIVFTVTTKAGEIHFPIFDMEYAKGGITFTRLSHIYDKDGKWLDKPGTIYDLTKNVIYYDETAIYYGEKVAEAGISEDQMTLALATNNAAYNVNDAPKNFFSNLQDEDDVRYWKYNNLRTNGGEYLSRSKSGYVDVSDDSKIRFGDHSHTTNVIQYFDSKTGELLTSVTDEQKKMIDYLDSSKSPVGLSTGTGIYYKQHASGKETDPKTKDTSETGYVWTNVSGAQSTTDYAIANYWTFIPSKPAVSPIGSLEDTITIVDPGDEKLFNLTGRVFYDSSTNVGKFDDGSESGEYLIPGVTLNLYRKTTDTSYQADKTYVAYTGGTTPSLTPITTDSEFARADKDNIYERVDTGQTTSDGIYTFTGLKYNKTEGTEYIYEVKRPSDSYALTSKETTPGTVPSSTPAGGSKVYYGYYADKSYDKNGKGTEIQHIKVGGDGVDPTKYGYNNEKKTDENNVTVAAVDVGYTYVKMSKSLKVKKLWENGTETRPTSVVYEISYSTQNSNVTQNYGYWMLSSINGWSKEDLWLPAQQGSSTVDNYYVSAEYYIYCKNPSDPSSDYEIYKHTFAYDGKSGKYTDFVGTVYSVSNPDYIEEGSIADINKDGVKDANDYGAIKDWKEIDVKDAPFRAVLDKSDSSDKIDVNITNSAESGTVQIFKYKDENKTENALQGATFRIYEGDIATIKGYVDNGNTAELAKCRVGSSTSRDNGLLAFPNLDPNTTYTVREISPPGGYRMLREYYQVVPNGTSITDEEEQKYTVAFDADGVAELNIGNVLADSNFFIRKRILGRAWQNADGGIPMDSFAFKIKNNFEVAISGALSSATGITVDANEISLQTTTGGGGIAEGRGEAGLIEELEKFEAAINNLDNVTINYNSKYYTAKVTSGNVEYEISTDEKVSDGLIVAGDESGTAHAAFRGTEFPMAGTYTFTIEEELPADQGTLQYSKRKYTVEVTVTRKLSKGHESESTITLANSYLEAAVSRITYTDDGGSPTDFASNSPSFTNIYAPAPAKQTTSYAISKEFTGRPEGWLTSDKFTINIVGVGSETQTAIQNKNLSIDGLKSYLNEEVNKWQYTFKNDGTVPFTSFTFKDIEFPVEFVKQDGTVWTPTKDDEQPPADVTARTMPVEYWLRIYEEIPSGATGAESNIKDGITYDTTNYYLHIILRNTFEKDVSKDSEEEDGIIDEIDMYLYKQNSEMTLEALQALDSATARASCLTKQEVLSKEDWIQNATATDGGTYSWWYFDSSGVLTEATTHNSVPSGANEKLLIRKWEKHDNAADHTMPFSNEYKAAAYNWAPTIHKTLSGRVWDENDKFTFTIKCTGGNVDNVSPSSSEITITQSDKATGEDYYARVFDTITFKEPGEYVFTITETHLGGGITVEDPKTIEDGTYTITVTITDNTNGQLTATFNTTYNSSTPINVTNVYADTANSFELDISKKIIGRNWESGDSFTFTITPDDDTKEAINDGLLEMPTDISPDSEGNYTVTLSGRDSGVNTSKDVFQKVLGEITAKGLPTDKNDATYTFSIKETAVPTNMKCREQTIDLTINVSRERAGGTGAFTGNLIVTATYSYMGDTGTKTEGSLSGTDPKAVIPFVNVCISSLTVEKKVVSTSGTDTQSFEFTVEFEFDESKILEAEQNAITSSSVGGITAPKKDGNTWTFSLSDGQSVKFTNIPAYTTYKISEDNTDTGYMFLRALDENGTAIETTTTGTKTAMNSLLQINVESPSKVTFVNGRIIDLPSTGGAGINTILLLGMIITAAATATLIILLCKSGKSRDNPNG